MTDTTLYTIYRRLHAVDEGEDRALGLDDDKNIVTRQGPIDASTECRRKPIAACEGGMPWRDLHLIAARWKRDGFARIGTGRCAQRRIELVARDDGPRVALHWQATEAIGTERWTRLMRDIAASLHDAGLRARCRQPKASRSDAPWLDVLTPSGAWRLNRLSNGRFGEHGRAGVAAVYARDCTAPILVLMLIELECPGAVAFTWRASGEPQPVQPHLTPTDLWLGEPVAPFEETQRIAAALGVTPAQRPRWNRDDTPSIWF